MRVTKAAQEEEQVSPFWHRVAIGVAWTLWGTVLTLGTQAAYQLWAAQPATPMHCWFARQEGSHIIVHREDKRRGD